MSDSRMERHQCSEYQEVVVVVVQLFVVMDEPKIELQSGQSHEEVSSCS